MLKTQAIGNVGRDAYYRETNGSFALNFAIAHNERVITGDGEVIDKTVWVNCTKWMKKKTDISTYLKKGTLVHVSGTPSVKIYRNKETGQNQVDFRLKVDFIELLSSPKSEEKPAPKKSEAQLMEEARKADEKAEREVAEAFD